MYTFRQTNRKTLILASLAAGLTLGIAAATYATVVGTSTFAGPDDPRGGAPAEEIPNPGSVPAIPKVERDPVPDKVEPPSSPICEGTPRVCAAALSIGAAARGGSPAVLRLFEAFAIQCPNETHPDDRSGCKQRPGESLEVVAFTLGGKEASLLPLAELDRFLRDWLAKPGPIAIAAVGCPQPDPAVRPDCSTGFATTLVISARTDDARSVVLLGRLSADGQPRLFGAYFGTSNEVAVVGGRQQVARPTVDNLRWFYFQRWLDQAGSAAIWPAQGN